MKKYTLLIFFLSITGFSQIHEIGFFAGGTNFIGDIGSTMYINPNKIGGGLVYKYNLNPRIALRGNYNYLQIGGDDKKSDDFAKRTRGFSFTNNIHEISLGAEINFWKYDIRDVKHYYTPYILIQAAAFRYKSPVKYVNEKLQTTNKISYTIPVGVGFKGRISDNLAFAIETAVRFTIIDDLDYSTNKIQKLNFGKSFSDTYVFTAFSLVYSFGRPPCYNF